MLKELEENLQSMESEIAKFKAAVSHIEKSKEVASKAVELADKTNYEFKEHIQKVTLAVDSILKPHQELIMVTENLVKTMNTLDFTAMLQRQEKEIKHIKMILYGLVGVSLLGTILILILK